MIDQDSIGLFLNQPSAETFSALFRMLAPRLIGYFRVRGCDVSLAEDLTQEVMLSVYRQSKTLREKDLFLPWLFKIARNALLQHVRQQGRQVPTTKLDARRHDPGVPADDLALRSRFLEWMEWLQPEEREILTLRYVEGLEYHEIAASLGIPLGTVQWRIFNCKKKLAGRFGQE